MLWKKNIGTFNNKDLEREKTQVNARLWDHTLG